MMSMPPQASIAALTKRSAKSSAVTSPAQATASLPSARISSAVSLAGSASRSLTATRAPSRASLSASALPMPRPEPGDQRDLAVEFSHAFSCFPFNFRQLRESVEIFPVVGVSQPPPRPRLSASHRRFSSVAAMSRRRRCSPSCSNFSVTVPVQRIRAPTWVMAAKRTPQPRRADCGTMPVSARPSQAITSMPWAKTSPTPACRVKSMSIWIGLCVAGGAGNKGPASGGKPGRSSVREWRRRRRGLPRSFCVSSIRGAARRRRSCGRTKCRPGSRHRSSAP